MTAMTPTASRLSRWLALSVAAVVTGTAGAQCSYSVRLLQEPLHPQCPASPPAEGVKGINNHGECVGEYLICAGSLKPCRWDANGNWYPIVIPGMSEGSAKSIGDDGTIIGTAVIGGTERWFRIQDGQTIITPFPCEQLYYAKGVAYIADGVSAGTVYCADPSFVHGFVQTAEGEWINIGLDIAPNDSTKVANASPTGFVVGQALLGFAGVDSRGFRWQGGRALLLPAVPGGYTSSASDVNRWGDVSGRGLYDLPDWPRGDPVKGFLYVDGVMQDAGFLPGMTVSHVDCINDLGQGAGASGEHLWSNPLFHAVLWQHGKMHKVIDLVTDPNVFQIPSIKTLNDRGEMTATVWYQSVSRPIVLTPIRERDGDVDLDCAVNLHDLQLVLRTWGSAYDYDHGPGDATNDGVVDARDIAVVLGDWDPR